MPVPRLGWENTSGKAVFFVVVVRLPNGGWWVYKEADPAPRPRVGADRPASVVVRALTLRYTAARAFPGFSASIQVRVPLKESGYRAMHQRHPMASRSDMNQINERYSFRTCRNTRVGPRWTSRNAVPPDSTLSSSGIVSATFVTSTRLTLTITSPG